MPKFKIYTETLTHRIYYVEAANSKEAVAVFYDTGADIADEEIIREDVDAVVEVTNE